MKILCKNSCVFENKHFSVTVVHGLVSKATITCTILLRDVWYQSWLHFHDLVVEGIALLPVHPLGAQFHGTGGAEVGVEGRHSAADAVAAWKTNRLFVTQKLPLCGPRFERMPFGANIFAQI